VTARITVARTASALRTAVGGADVGFVPTMGYLHDGHATLVRRARAESGAVVVSIFVNPSQFGPGEDFATYPRDLDRDLALLESLDVDCVFVPAAEEMYPDGVKADIRPGAVAGPLEGERRPGHFAGVATVVARLVDMVRPARAYFGEKDWQQLQVVRALVRDRSIPVEIVAVPTVREPDGLAMSSRNVRLSPDERARALCVPRALDAARLAWAAGETNPAVLERTMAAVIEREPAATLDYAVVRDAETLLPVARTTGASRALIAARVGPVRLIDNAPLGTS
jgi:pantoate--beta-alanine ligase